MNENESFGNEEAVMKTAKFFAEQIVADMGPDHPMTLVVAGLKTPAGEDEPGYGLLFFPPERFPEPEQVYAAARAILEEARAVGYAMITTAWLTDPATGARMGEAETITVATRDVAFTAISTITREGDQIAFAPWLDGERTTPANAGRAAALLINEGGPSAPTRSH
jgi:hypothetical protein